MKPRTYTPPTSPRVKVVTVEPVTDHFVGNPDASKLYPVRRPHDDHLPPILTGRCAWDGQVLCQWHDVDVFGPADKPTVVKIIGGEIATLACNCPNCGHKWQVVEGKVIDRSDDAG